MTDIYQDWNRLIWWKIRRMHIPAYLTEDDLHQEGLIAAIRSTRVNPDKKYVNKAIDHALWRATTDPWSKYAEKRDDRELVGGEWDMPDSFEWNAVDIRLTLQALPIEHRKFILLRMENYTIKEIAEIMDVSERKVKSMVKEISEALGIEEPTVPLDQDGNPKYCRKGMHRMEGDNVTTDVKGSRVCRQCVNAKQRDKNARDSITLSRN
jgi:DNA-directed RNA polymerase specialized sigma24 family protein